MTRKRRSLAALQRLSPWHALCSLRMNSSEGVRDMPTNTRSRSQGNGKAPSPSPILHQRAAEIQPFGTLRDLPIGLNDKARKMACERVNQILADTMTIRDLYQKHHWQVAGPTFYQLHLLFEKHYNEQAELVDAMAERVQVLGGISIAMAHDVAEFTRIKRPPR